MNETSSWLEDKLQSSAKNEKEIARNKGKEREKAHTLKKLLYCMGKKQSFLRQNFSLKYLQFHSNPKKSKHFKEKFGH